ncbi:adenylyl-sulfate kinase [Pseudomonas sp. MF4836]|jgi:adenylylsulfate kinase|uniref:adenylyl-sulfate kinase n=1 Tax=Pseudomonas sp. MF4836 TaxID=1960827 RepID=UPI000996FC0F|nr:adenylyl-sulfate kinase [Pseudomonas sp. MF4836]
MSIQLNSHVRWHEHRVTSQMRAASMSQKGLCVWFTGLSGAGKSTLANALEIELHRAGKKTYLLDGDNVRHGLCGDLGMSEVDRTENVRRAGEVAKLMVDAGLIVLCAFISPYQRDRERVRALFESEQFVEVYVSTPLKACETRDTKGLYSKARQGLLCGLTGVDSPYEQPVAPEISVDTCSVPLADAVQRLLDFCENLDS